VTTLGAALSWSGFEVTLSLFVVWAGDKSELVPPSTSTTPRLVRGYDLVDEGGLLDGRATSEFDLVFDSAPADLNQVVEAWLTTAIRAGGLLAWFGFEGSFSFEHLLTADVADQVYGIAAPDLIALATDDSHRMSDGWATELAAARRMLG
jgi:hypothetical protein